VRWLGWAGVEIEEHDERLVIDPLRDPAAVFAWIGEGAVTMPRPEVTAPDGPALAGLLTHLHRDHADAAALAGALVRDAVVYEPPGQPAGGGSGLGVAQADGELAAAGLERRPAAPWTSTSVGPFTVTALPAVDGTGDPQVSWLVESGATRVLHLGDTMFHGWWWRFAEAFGAPSVVFAPVNGARLTFPHRRPASPLPAVMDPEQAALAAEIMRAERLVPIHYDGYAVPGIYEPESDPLGRLRSASERVDVLRLGEAIEL
jgi:L-ascorbate metabolism protein UlaG (beta-lactamase superfamily)